MIAAVAGHCLLELRDSAAIDRFFEATIAQDPTFWRWMMVDDEWIELSSGDITWVTDDTPLKSYECFVRIAGSAIRTGNLGALQWKTNYLVEHTEWIENIPVLEEKYDEAVLSMLTVALQDASPAIAKQAFEEVVKAYKARWPAEPYLLSRTLTGCKDTAEVGDCLV